MTKANQNKPGTKAAADELRSKLGAAMAKSQPPPAVLTFPVAVTPTEPSPARVTGEGKASLPAIAPRPPGKPKLTSISLPMNDLGRADEISVWLQQQTGERGIGASTVVKTLLRMAKLDQALLETYQVVRAEDGRRRR